jgi:hypothetical protein
MTRVLVWKEVREQWAVWLALALVATGTAAGLISLISPGPNRDQMLTAVLWMTAWGYGLVCGAVLLAGETEGETQPFLDSLPTTRPHIWRVKAATGLALLAAQLAALVTVGFLLFRERYGQSRPVFDLTGMLACGVIGYAWGLYCGSFAGNVLGAVARAVVLQAVWGVAVYLVVTVAMLLYGLNLQSILLPSAMGLVTAAVAVRSRAIYCRPDRLRAAALRPRARLKLWAVPEGFFGGAFREARWFALGAGLYAVVCMAALVFLGVAAWPALTLLLGVACGVTVHATGRESDRWLARAAVRFGIGVAATGIATLIVVVPVVYRHETQSGGFELFLLQASASSALATNPAVFVALWLVLGYASGLLSGFLFERRLPAAVLGLTLACLFGAAWLPTVYTGGGLHTWQTWVTPAVFLAAAVLLARSREAGRLTAGRAVGVAGVALLTAGLATAASWWHRATEMPPVADAVDVEAFRASLPGPKENVGGQLTLEALQSLLAVETRFSGVDVLQRGGRRLFFFDITNAGKVTEHGWKAADALLGDFLDRTFATDDWARKLADAAAQPTGTLLAPRGTTPALVAPEFRIAGTAATLLAARGLQLQEAGQPEAFLDHLETGLALARTERHFADNVGAIRSASVEATLCRGVERWLERLDGRPDLLRRALALLTSHLNAPRPDPEIMRRVELLTMTNAFADPADVPRSGRGNDPFFRLALNDTPFLRYSWHVPWEKVRLRRVLEGIESADPEVRKLTEGMAPPVVKSVYFLFSSFARFRSPPWGPRHQYACRAAALQVALRLYQAETGRAAEKLTDLVPKYLAAVPLDPYDGQPFRYRISRGETIDWPPDDVTVGTLTVKRDVPAGQGILWAVGLDQKDDGGHTQEWEEQNLKVPDQDRISLVPLPPGRP